MLLCYIVILQWQNQLYRGQLSEYMHALFINESSQILLVHLNVWLFQKINKNVINNNHKPLWHDFQRAYKTGMCWLRGFKNLFFNSQFMSITCVKLQFNCIRNVEKINPQFCIIIYEHQGPINHMIEWLQLKVKFVHRTQMPLEQIYVGHRINLWPTSVTLTLNIVAWKYLCVGSHGSWL